MLTRLSRPFSPASKRGKNSDLRVSKAGPVSEALRCVPVVVGLGISAKTKNMADCRLRVLGPSMCGEERVLGKVKTSQISFKNAQWYLSLTVETEVMTREDRPSKACALDWGVETLVSVIEPGGRQTTVDNPRFYRRSAEQIVKLQQSLSNKKRGSNRYRKAHRNLAKARARLQRQRTDRQHKLSARLAKDYALIATEELNIKKMTKSAKGTQEKPGSWVKQKAGLNREILDTAPARLFDMIRYKVEETGGLFMLAPTRALKPSQRCPNCGTVAKKTLSQRDTVVSVAVSCQEIWQVHLLSLTGHWNPGRNCPKQLNTAKPIPNNLVVVVH